MRKLLKGICIFLIIVVSIGMLICFSAGFSSIAIGFLVFLIPLILLVISLRKTKPISIVEEAKKTYQFSFTGQHIEGLPNVIQNGACLFTMDNTHSNCFIIETIDTSNTKYIINISQVTNIGIMSDSEIIQSNNKSVVGRGIVGGLMLGGLGAIIGGMSALKPTNTRIIHHYLIINARDKNNEIKTISFKIVSSFNSKVKEFVQIIQQQISPKITEF